MADGQIFIPSEHQIFVRKIFGAFGALFGIALFFAIKILVRRFLDKRRTDPNLDESVPPKKILLPIKFPLPEVMEFPEAEREALCQKAFSSDEVLLFRRRFQMVMGILYASPILIGVLLFVFGINSWVVIFGFGLGVVLLFIMATLFRFKTEVRIARKWLGNELTNRRGS